MPGYSFRMKLVRSPGAVLTIDATRIQWDLAPGTPPVALTSGASGVTIRDSDRLVLVSDGWPSAEAARENGEMAVSALLRSLARLRIGVDYGGRSRGPGGVSDDLIQKVLDEYGQRVINERKGLIVYETDPTPSICWADAIGRLGIHRPEFESVFSAALHEIEPLSPREKVAADLYNSSFFQPQPDGRLLLLVMAVEALAEPMPLSAEAQDVVDKMTAVLTEAGGIPNNERASIRGRLDALKNESIRQATKRVVTERLGDRMYSQMPAPKFFDSCYHLRSSLVHGDCPLPGASEVGHAAANMESLVGDLLAGRLLGLDVPSTG